MRRVCLLLLAASCSPIRSMPGDSGYQIEFAMHEAKTSVEDFRHTLNTFKAEFEILDGRFKYFENALAAIKREDLERYHSKIEGLSAQVGQLEKKLSTLERVREAQATQLEQLTQHANESTVALTQAKQRIDELESELKGYHRKFDELAKLKGSIESLARNLKAEPEKAKTYRVRPGDTLEKIAKAHGTSVDKLKKLNDLGIDLIVVGQELKLPNE